MKLRMPKAQTIVLSSMVTLAAAILLASVTSIIVVSRGNPQPIVQASPQATADRERIQILEGQIAELTSKLAQQPPVQSVPQPAPAVVVATTPQPTPLVATGPAATTTPQIKAVAPPRPQLATKATPPPSPVEQSSPSTATGPASRNGGQHIMTQEDLDRAREAAIVSEACARAGQRC
jgi:hypothetical protein